VALVRVSAVPIREEQKQRHDALHPWAAQSGNGRENGKVGLEKFLEVKAICGYNAA
jgi:hypothetical protein